MYGPQDIWIGNGHLFDGHQVLLVAVVLGAVVISYVATRKQSQGKQPPWLTETIPHVTNIYQVSLSLPKLLCFVVSGGIFWGWLSS